MPYIPPPPQLPLAVPLNPAAPLSDVMPSANPVVNAAIGAAPVAAINAATAAVTGSPEIVAIAGALNIALEWTKNQKWFPEERWTVPLLFVLSFVVCLLVWHVFFQDDKRGIINAFGTIVNAHTNYMGAQVSGIGLLKPTAAENKWAA